MGKLDFRLGRKLESYQKKDSPPTRLRPLPVSVIQALDTAAQGTTTRNIAISDLTWVAFLFLLRSGGYCKGGTNTSQQPFRIKDVQFFIVQHPYNNATASNAVISQANFVSLLVTTQSNDVKGKSIGNSCTGHHQGCLVEAMRLQVAYIRCHGATSDTFLSSYNKGTKWKHIQGGDITANVIAFVWSAGPSIGFTEADISARSL